MLRDKKKKGREKMQFEPTPYDSLLVRALNDFLERMPNPQDGKRARARRARYGGVEVCNLENLPNEVACQLEEHCRAIFCDVIPEEKMVFGEGV